ncbi:MAG: hypothetical protein LBN92_03780 [Treponema sp.]|jgi:hypothetical protein|nr:hypothetical protein [Treponema sp.]
MADRIARLAFNIGDLYDSADPDSRAGGRYNEAFMAELRKRLLKAEADGRRVLLAPVQSVPRPVVLADDAAAVAHCRRRLKNCRALAGWLLSGGCGAESPEPGGLWRAILAAFGEKDPRAPCFIARDGAFYALTPSDLEAGQTELPARFRLESAPYTEEW